MKILSGRFSRLGGKISSPSDIAPLGPWQIKTVTIRRQPHDGTLRAEEFCRGLRERKRRSCCAEGQGGLRRLRPPTREVSRRRFARSYQGVPEPIPLRG